MWLSTTLVLIHGLLLVHVLMVSCSNYRFGSPGPALTSSSTPATNKGMMTSADLMAKYGAIKIDELATKTFDEQLKEGLKNYKPPSITSPPPSMSRNPPGPIVTRAEVVPTTYYPIEFSRRPGSPQVTAPTPRSTSSSSNGMGSSLPINNPSPSPPNLPVKTKTKTKIFSKIDNRRLDGRQTQQWPQLGGYYRIEDAGKCLGPVFAGILVPNSTIKYVRSELENSKKLSTINKAAGVGRVRQFTLEIEPKAYDDFDVDMLHQAIREVQGDFDDYDNPDPWTYATTYSKEVLDYNRELHNYYRAKHYAGPLEYFDVIHPESHAYAVKMAEYLSHTSINNLDHNIELLNRNMWSENLYADEISFDGRAPAMVVKRAVDSFYEEIDLWNNQYNMKHPNVQDPVTGHFTCLVWRSSKRMGMGLAKYRNNERNKTTYVAVFNYDPRGNVQGYYDSNVLEPHAYDDGRPLPKAICPYPSKFVNDTNY